MRLIFLVIVFLFSYSPFIEAQNNYIEYYNNVNEGEYQYYYGSIDSAINLFEKAFKIADPFSKDLYLLGMSYCKILDTLKCKKYLLAASDKSLLFPRSISKLDSIVLYNCFNDDSAVKLLWSECQDNINKKIRETSDNPKTQKLKDTLKFFELRDQLYRSLNDNRNFLTNHSDTSDTARQYRELSNRNDSIIQIQFLQYVTDNGFPSVEYGDLFTSILVHFSPSNYSPAKKVFFKELSEGRLDPFYYGMMVDRLEFLLNHKDCYYAIMRNNCDKQEWKNIIYRRKQAGISIYFNSPQWRRFSTQKLPLPWISKE